jgi:hypothetical protein
MDSEMERYLLKRAVDRIKARRVDLDEAPLLLPKLAVSSSSTPSSIQSEVYFEDVTHGSESSLPPEVAPQPAPLAADEGDAALPPPRVASALPSPINEAVKPADEGVKSTPRTLPPLVARGFGLQRSSLDEVLARRSQRSFAEAPSLQAELIRASDTSAPIIAADAASSEELTLSEHLLSRVRPVKVGLRPLAPGEHQRQERQDLVNSHFRAQGEAIQERLENVQKARVVLDSLLAEASSMHVPRLDPLHPPQAAVSSSWLTVLVL